MRESACTKPGNCPICQKATIAYHPDPQFRELVALLLKNQKPITKPQTLTSAIEALLATPKSSFPKEQIDTLFSLIPTPPTFEFYQQFYKIIYHFKNLASIEYLIVKINSPLDTPYKVLITNLDDHGEQYQLEDLTTEINIINLFLKHGASCYEIVEQRTAHINFRNLAHIYCKLIANRPEAYRLLFTALATLVTYGPNLYLKDENGKRAIDYLPKIRCFKALLLLKAYE